MIGQTIGGIQEETTITVHKLLEALRKQVLQQEQDNVSQSTIGTMAALAAVLEVPAVPIAVAMGAAGDRTTNVASLPAFFGWPGADPDQHVAQFLTAAVANNGRTENIWLMWFPATLKDTAFEWYNRQPIGQFPNWATLRQAFLTHFRPIGFEDRLRERLMNSRMLPGEAVESYYGRVADTLRKWPNNQMSEPFVLSILVNGLYPPQLKNVRKRSATGYSGCIS